MISTSQPNLLSLNYSNNTDSISTNKRVKKFLQFQLGREENITGTVGDKALLDAKLVTEIITISNNEILPVPQMPHCVIGIYGWRSEMLWIVDLENLLGYPPSQFINTEEIEPELADLTLMIVQYQGLSLGLVIPKVDSIVQYNLDAFKSSSVELFSEDLMPFLQGYFTDSNNDIIMVLDAEEIFKLSSLPL